jgi:deoxyribodipyrimidine photo-lyase
MKSFAPDLRLSVKNEAPVNPDGDFVLYWMIASRRASWNLRASGSLGPTSEAR